MRDGVTSNLIEDSSGFAQAGYSLIKEWNLLVGCGSKHMPELLRRALVLILPEIRARDGDVWSLISL